MRAASCEPPEPSVSGGETNMRELAGITRAGDGRRWTTTSKKSLLRNGKPQATGTFTQKFVVKGWTNSAIQW